MVGGFRCRGRPRTGNMVSDESRELHPIGQPLTSHCICESMIQKRLFVCMRWLSSLCMGYKLKISTQKKIEKKKIKYPQKIKSYSIPRPEYAPHATNATLEFHSYPFDLPHFALRLISTDSKSQKSNPCSPPLLIPTTAYLPGRLYTRVLLLQRLKLR